MCSGALRARTRSARSSSRRALRGSWQNSFAGGLGCECHPACRLSTPHAANLHIAEPDRLEGLACTFTASASSGWTSSAISASTFPRMYCPRKGIQCAQADLLGLQYHLHLRTRRKAGENPGRTFSLDYSSSLLLFLGTVRHDTLSGFSSSPRQAVSLLDIP